MAFALFGIRHFILWLFGYAVQYSAEGICIFPECKADVCTVKQSTNYTDYHIDHGILNTAENHPLGIVVENKADNILANFPNTRYGRRCQEGKNSSKGKFPVGKGFFRFDEQKK